MALYGTRRGSGLGDAKMLMSKTRRQSLALVLFAHLRSAPLVLVRPHRSSRILRIVLVAAFVCRVCEKAAAMPTRLLPALVVEISPREF